MPNLSRYPQFVTVLSAILLVTALMISGCGNKGPLTQPTQQNQPAQQ